MHGHLAREEAAVRKAFARSLEDLDEAWEKHVKRRYPRD